MPVKTHASYSFRRGHSLLEMLAVIGLVSFLMWMIVGVFEMSAKVRRGVQHETETIKSTARLSREFRSDVHGALRITWAEAGMIPEFKSNAASDAVGLVVPPVSSDADYGVMPLAPRNDEPALGDAEDFDSPPEPAELTTAEKAAAGKKTPALMRVATRLDLTMRDGSVIRYVTTPGGLERSVRDAKGERIRRNVTRLAPAAFATLKLEETGNRPLAVLVLNYPVPKSQRHRDELTSSRQMRIVAMPLHQEAP